MSFVPLVKGLNRKRSTSSEEAGILTPGSFWTRLLHGLQSAGLPGRVWTFQTPEVDETSLLLTDAASLENPNTLRDLTEDASPQQEKFDKSLPYLQ